MATERISYDPRGVLLPEHGVTQGDLDALAPKLEAARSEVLADADLWQSGNEIPTEKQPLDAGYQLLPERLLAELQEKADDSEIGRIQQSAANLFSC